MKKSLGKYFLFGSIVLISAGMGILNAATGDGGKPGKASTVAPDSGSKSGKKAPLPAKKEKHADGPLKGLSNEDIKKSDKADEEKLLKIRQREKARAEEMALKAKKDSSGTNEKDVKKADQGN